jgi:hypothetical protein
MCDAVCDAALTPLCADYECPICFDYMRKHKVFSISEEYLVKKKSVYGRIVLLTFYSKWAKSKNVKLRILRIQSVASFGNPNLLIVEFRWKLIFLKLVFSDWHQ